MLIIAITGPSASGKSMLASALRQQLYEVDVQVALLQEDSYYHDQSGLNFAQRTKVNYDHPAAFEHELLEQHLNELDAGRAVQVPEYDFTQHNRSKNTHQVAVAPVLIVEGILLLSNPRLRGQFDISVYVDTDIDTCLERRIARDTTERGRSRESVIKQFEATVRPMYHEFIFPMRAYADLVATEGGKDQAVIEQLKYKVLQHLRDLENDPSQLSPATLVERK